MTSLWTMADGPKQAKYPHLGRRIRLAREAMRPVMTQADVADALGVDSNHVSRIERGLVRPPRKGRKILASLFRKPDDYFIDEPIDDVAATTLPARLYEFEQRYANARDAAKIARDQGVGDDAVSWVLLGGHKLREDASIDEWLQAMKDREREARAESSALAQDVQRRAKVVDISQARVDDAKRKDKPKMPKPKKR